MLPDRIELSTSPLPMECSTTELRQHARIRESAETAPRRRADPCHKAPAGASARAAGGASGTAEIGPDGGIRSVFGRIDADPVPDFVDGLRTGSCGTTAEAAAGPEFSKSHDAERPCA